MSVVICSSCGRGMGISSRLEGFVKGLLVQDVCAACRRRSEDFVIAKRRRR